MKVKGFVKHDANYVVFQPEMCISGIIDIIFIFLRFRKTIRLFVF